MTLIMWWDLEASFLYPPFFVGEGEGEDNEMYSQVLTQKLTLLF